MFKFHLILFFTIMSVTMGKEVMQIVQTISKLLLIDKVKLIH